MSGPLVTDVSRSRDAAPGEERLRERCLANALWAKFYEGWELIGRGAYGTVIGTRHRTLGDIAIKAFEWLSPEEESRFDQEAAALARLLHPSIVRIYGVFKDDGLYWFEMERVHGPTLKDALEGRQATGAPVGLQEAVEIAIDITEALQTAHAAGVVHRDVKPANVLLPQASNGRAPRAKLGDFGVSRLFDAARRTATGMVVGSYEYAAPELFAGRTATAASDVYSFMVLLYRLLTDNSYPYEINGDRSPVSFMEAHTRQAALPVGLLKRGLPQELQDVITLGLSKDPRRRPSWPEVLDALHRTMRLPASPAGASLSDSPPRRSQGADSTVSRWIRPGTAVSRYVMGVSVVAAAIGVVVTRGGPEESSRTPREVKTDISRTRAFLEETSSREAPPPDERGLRIAGPGPNELAPGGRAAGNEPAGRHDVPNAQYGVTVEVAPHAMKVRNVSQTTSSVRVIAITRTGSRHAVTVSRLDPGLQQTVFLEALKPPLAAATEIAGVEVTPLTPADDSATTTGPRR